MSSVEGRGPVVDPVSHIVYAAGGLAVLWYAARRVPPERRRSGRRAGRRRAGPGLTYPRRDICSSNRARAKSYRAGAASPR